MAPHARVHYDQRQVSEHIPLVPARRNCFIPKIWLASQEGILRAFNEKTQNRPFIPRFSIFFTLNSIYTSLVWLWFHMI